MNRRRSQVLEPDMRTIKTTTGAPIALDGDLLAIMEALYREVTAKRALERSFEDMVKEIQHLIDQMDDSERRAYLAESLFLNTVKYENDKLEAYMRKLSNK
jgi:phage gp29-like protein